MRARLQRGQVPWTIVVAIVVADLLILATTGWLLLSRTQAVTVSRAVVHADLHPDVTLLARAANQRVDPTGVEPATSALQRQRSAN